MGKERRRSPRVAVDVPARITVEDETVEARLRDICRDAALLFAARSWPTGTRLTVETELPRVSGGVRFSGPVVRIADGEDGQHGVAVLFDDIAPQDVLRIELFVEDPVAG